MSFAPPPYPGAIKPQEVRFTPHPLRGKVKRTWNPNCSAHGFVEGAYSVYPYRIEQDRIDGAHVHFWITAVEQQGFLTDMVTMLAMLDAAMIALSRTDAVTFSYSFGTPASFETKNFIGRK